MDKLIKLLNEYETWKRGERCLRWYTWWFLYYIQYCNEYLDLKIISKSYGFIKWLVKNNKVDLKKANNIDNWPLFDYYYDEDALIMALSKHDHPIKFLISILK